MSFIKALELFCGIGGFAAAAAGSNIRVVGAIDQSLVALGVYQINFPSHRVRSINLQGVTGKLLTAHCADFWWMSPPCQPYSIRGKQKGLADPRAASFIRILKILSALPEEDLPFHLGFENVTGFADSEARSRLVDLLARKGYQIQECLLCPTQLEIPLRRPRYYLVASRNGLRPVPTFESRPMVPLQDFLDSDKSGGFSSELLLPTEVVARFGAGLHILDGSSPSGCATCFTSGYGRSYMHAGSYLRFGKAVRHFSPLEIARLLHLPSGFRFPEGMPLRKQWQLVGNSLSVAAVRALLKAFPGVLPPANGR